MSKQHRFAAIDIGSNAVRLLLSGVFENKQSTVFKKMALMRMPIRLGEDAFIRHRISKEKIGQLVTTMQGFRSLIDAYAPIDYLACATSAMREADNGVDICDSVLKKAGIKINIIDGLSEAQVIFANRSKDFFDARNTYLYIAVGGGSTEITFFSKHRRIASQSFNIGTIRILKDLVSKRHWKEMKQWIEGYKGDYSRIAAIGSGGNINKIFRLANTKTGKPLIYDKMREVKKFLNSFTLDQRITELKLRPDRADVILPAAKIYMSAMKWAGIENIYVPQIGLADGLVRLLFEHHKSGKKNKLQQLGNGVYWKMALNQ